MPVVVEVEAHRAQRSVRHGTRRGGFGDAAALHVALTPPRQCLCSRAMGFELANGEGVAHGAVLGPLQQVEAQRLRWRDIAVRVAPHVVVIVALAKVVVQVDREELAHVLVSESFRA